MNWVYRYGHTTHKSKHYKWQNIHDLMHKGARHGVVYSIGDGKWFGYVAGIHGQKYREVGPCKTEQATKVAIELLLV